jgi:hypothetical protein
MKTTWLAIITALNLLFGFGAKADISGSITSGEVQKGEKPETREDQGDWAKGEKPGKPDRPERPDSSGNNAAMKEIVVDFQTRTANLRAQRGDLVKQLKDATEEERAKLRGELQANREALVKLKEQFRDEIQALHDSLKDHTDKVDAEAKAAAKENGKAGRSRD